jgi:four helix bundle protein
MTAVKYQGLEQLIVWQRSVAFAEKLCKEILPSFPREEKYGMISQLRRAVQSIPANIAEGYGRFYYQEGIRFSYLAGGSLEEVFTHLTLASRLDLISSEVFRSSVSEIEEIRRLLHGYIAYLKKSKRGEKEPGNIYQIHDFVDKYMVDPEDDGQSNTQSS